MRRDKLSNTIEVSVGVDEAIDIIHKEIVGGSFTGVLIDRYEIMSSNNKKCIVLIYEKHYYRAGNRLTLTIVIDEFEEKTRIHCKGGGGGKNLWNVDWGAAIDFEESVVRILDIYRI